MSNYLGERFGVTPEIVAGSNTTYTEESNDTVENCLDSRVTVPGRPPAGLTYRYKLAGTAGGGNDSHTVLLVLNGTTIMTLTADAVTAADWVAEFTVRFTDSQTQKIMGYMVQDSFDGEVDFATGAVDCTAETVLEVRITNTDARDSTTCEMLTCEKWVF